MPLPKYIGNRFLTFLENLFFKMNISEYHSGYLAYSKKAIKKIPFNKLSNTFCFDSEMLLISKKKELKLVELPIFEWQYLGKSNLNPIKYGFNVLKIIIKNILRKYNS
jgi:hypothetical protein